MHLQLFVHNLSSNLDTQCICNQGCTVSVLMMEGPFIPPGIVPPEGTDGVGHGESGDRLE